VGGHKDGNVGILVFNVSKNGNCILQLKALMGNIITSSYAVTAQCGLIYYLHCDTGLNICIGTSGIAFD
jgi:hypothetical protein